MVDIDCPIGLNAHTIWLKTRVLRCLDYPGDLSVRSDSAFGQRPFVAEWTKKFLPNEAINITTLLRLAKILHPMEHHNINGTVIQDDLFNENSKLVSSFRVSSIK